MGNQAVKFQMYSIARGQAVEHALQALTYQCRGRSSPTHRYSTKSSSSRPLETPSGYRTEKRKNAISQPLLPIILPKSFRKCSLVPPPSTQNMKKNKKGHAIGRMLRI
jgi:hypothetical protein